MKRALSQIFALSLSSIIMAAAFTAEDERWLGPNAYKQEQVSGYLNDGIALIEAGDYSAAEKNFSAALQAAKVNHGIKSPEQVIALELLIQAQMGHRNWRTINQYLAHFEWLNGEIYKTDLDRYLQGMDALANLYLRAAADPLNPQAAHYLISARNLTWNVVSAIEREHGRDNALLSPWLYKIVLSHFYQAGSVKRRGMTSYDYKSDDAVIINGWSLSKNEYVDKSHNIGLELLTRIKALEAKHNGPESEAIMLIYLGDWETLFGNETAALDYYQQSFHGLQISGVDSGQIDAFFKHPSVLPEQAIYPNLSAFHTQRDDPDKITFNAWSSNFPAAERPFFIDSLTEPDRVFHAIVQLDSEGQQVLRQAISPSGQTRIETSGIDSSTSSQAVLSGSAKRRLEESIASLRFRPRLEGGKLVPRDEITVDYFFTQSEDPTILGSN